MDKVIDILLKGKTLDEVLSAGAAQICELGKRNKVRAFKTTKDSGLTVTELYPNSKPLRKF